MRVVSLVVFPALALTLAAGAAAADRGQEAVLVHRARLALQAGPRLSAGLKRSADQMLRRTGGPGQLFHYAPLARGRAITVFDARRTPGGFVSSSLTVTRTAPRTGAWDLLLINEVSGRRIIDIARAAKQLPGGAVLEVRYATGAAGKGHGTYALFDPAGKLIGRGGLKDLRSAPARLGVPARQVQALLTGLAPFGQ